MASDKAFVEYVAEQTGGAGEITFKHMFGEYGIYVGTKIFGLICDNKLFVKPTEAGRAFIGEVVEAPAYPGSKNFFLIEAQLEDRDWMSELIQVSAEELPAPKPKKKKAS
jgi:TfoX/Sxy family transcriptional regulator of competence genes